MRTYTVYEAPSLLPSYPSLLGTLLARRGISTTDEAELFLKPDYERDSHDPFLMKGMEKAVKRILQAIDRNEKIVIYSDYDADGIPGAVVFSDFFKRIKYPNVSFYIPHRGEEGYGVHKEAVEGFIKDGARVLITIDCGTNDTEAIKVAQEGGIDVIVTDHHIPHGKLSPAYSLVNPHQEGCTYPEKILCGAGLAFKVVQALFRKRDFGLPKGIEKWSLDMVALATLSDMVPLRGENRAFTHFGLTVLRRSPRKGLRALFDLLKLSQTHLTEDDITFMLTPRINAASRMGNPQDAFTLLSTEDEVEARRVASLLNDMNDERKGVVAGIVREVNERLKKESEVREIIVMGSSSWRPSVLGLVATRISENVGKPVFLWGREENEIIRGSCRSDGNLDLVALMTSTQESFVRFGGHRLAGGFTLEHENVLTLEETIVKAYQVLPAEAREKNGESNIIDKRLALPDVNWGVHNLISSLSPFGADNPKPVFLFENLVLDDVRHFGKKEPMHLSLRFTNGDNKPVSAIGFFMKKDDFDVPLEKGNRINLVGSLEKSVFRGFPELRLRIVDILPSL